MPVVWYGIFIHNSYIGKVSKVLVNMELVGGWCGVMI